MHEIGLIDESFERKHSLRYCLSIQLGLDGFSFSIFDPSQNKYLYLRYIPFVLQREELLAFHIEKIFKEEEILNDKYAKVAVLYKTSRSTLIPSAFYKNKEKEKLFAFNHILKKNEQVFACPLLKTDANVLFPISQDVVIKIRERHPEAEFYHQSFPIIEQALRAGDLNDNSYSVNLFCSKTFFDVAVCRNKQLEFYNQYSYQNENDFVYYLLHVFKQLKLSSTQTPVFVSGMLPRNSNHYVLMRKYIQNVSFEQPNRSVHYSIRFRQIPLHFFTPLFNLLACV